MFISIEKPIKKWEKKKKKSLHIAHKIHFQSKFNLIERKFESLYNNKKHSDITIKFEGLNYFLKKKVVKKY